MKFNKNLAAIHSYLCADGYVIKNSPTQKNKYYYIGFRNTDETLLKDFQKKFFDYFKIQPRLANDGRCVVQRKEIYEKLVKQFKSFYSKEWSAPKLNNKLMKIWLRAFFDCEGWVFCKTHQNRHIGLDSINEKGLDKIRIELEKIGIKSIKKIVKNGQMFRIFIYGKENLKLFQKKIGFLHPEKKTKLDGTIKDFVEYMWEFPQEKNKCKKFVKEIMSKKAKINCEKYIRIISKERQNLEQLKKRLKKFYGVNSLMGKRRNGIGTIYFEMNINKREEVQKLINKGLIPNILKL